MTSVSSVAAQPQSTARVNERLEQSVVSATVSSFDRAIKQLKGGVKATVITAVQVVLVAHFAPDFELAMFVLVVLALWEVQLLEVGFGE